MAPLPAPRTLPLGPDDLLAADGDHVVDDEIADLGDRRRVLLHLVFGVTVPADVAHAVFRPGALVQSSSTTSRSAGRPCNTVAT